MPVSAESPIIEIYGHLLTVISSERFLKMQGLGNEIPFFICPFDPTKTDEMNWDVIGPLINQLKSNGIRVLRIDLYDLAIELLKERGIWDQTLKTEPGISKSELKDLLQGVLDPAHHLVPEIAKRMDKEDFEVMFITGVGEVFP